MGYLLVIVFDVDSETIDDTVDAILIPIVPSSLGRFTRPEEYGGVFGFGKLTARYRVDCQNNAAAPFCAYLSVFRMQILPHSKLLSGAFLGAKA